MIKPIPHIVPTSIQQLSTPIEPGTQPLYDLHAAQKYILQELKTNAAEKTLIFTSNQLVISLVSSNNMYTSYKGKLDLISVCNQEAIQGEYVALY